MAVRKEGKSLNLYQKEGVPRKGEEVASEKGRGGVPTLEVTMLIKVVTINMNPMFTNFSLNIFIYKEILDYWCYYTSSG